MGGFDSLVSDIVSLIGDLLGIDAGAGKDWRDRVREAAYNSPSGTRIRFHYVGTSSTFSKRGTVHAFPGVDGEYIQLRGFTSRQYPLVCMFTGANCDLEATAFQAALMEDGLGRLEHPNYGEVSNVAPFGAIARNDNFVESGNLSIVSVTFWTSVTELYPSGMGVPLNEILASLGDFDVEAAQEASFDLDLSSAASEAGFVATIRKQMKIVSNVTQAVSDSITSVSEATDDLFDLVNEGLDLAIGDPLYILTQLSSLVTQMSTSTAGIGYRLKGYEAMLEGLLASQAGRSAEDLYVASGTGALAPGTPSGNAFFVTPRNDFQVTQFMASAAVSGAIRSVLNAQFETKSQALQAVVSVQAMFNNYIAWKEASVETLGFVDRGGAYRGLHASTQMTSGFLVEVSFSALAEATYVLKKRTTIINLAARFYGTTSTRILNRIILNNSLTGSNILRMPKGRSFVYYPKLR